MGEWRSGRISSVVLGWVPKALTRKWRGDLCRFRWRAAKRISQWMGLLAGRVVMRRYARWQILWSMNGMGVRLACATAASVAVVLMAPDDVSACVHKTLSKTFPWPFLPALFPSLATILAPHTSTPYSILGITTLLNKRWVYLFLIPRDGLARRRQARVYFVPFATALASCSLNRSFSSMMMPRNL